MTEIALEDIVESLRGSLQSAERKSSGEDLRFTVDKVEVELSVEIKSDAEASGGVKFYVFDFGAKISEGSSNSQSIKLTMTPTPQNGGRLQINDNTVKDKPDW